MACGVGGLKSIGCCCGGGLGYCFRGQSGSIELPGDPAIPFEVVIDTDYILRVSRLMEDGCYNFNLSRNGTVIWNEAICEGEGFSCGSYEVNEPQSPNINIGPDSCEFDCSPRTSDCLVPPNHPTFVYWTSDTEQLMPAEAFNARGYGENVSSSSFSRFENNENVLADISSGSGILRQDGIDVFGNIQTSTLAVIQVGFSVISSSVTNPTQSISVFVRDFTAPVLGGVVIAQDIETLSPIAVRVLSGSIQSQASASLASDVPDASGRYDVQIVMSGEAEVTYLDSDGTEHTANKSLDHTFVLKSPSKCLVSSGGPQSFFAVPFETRPVTEFAMWAQGR